MILRTRFGRAAATREVAFGSISVSVGSNWFPARAQTSSRPPANGPLNACSHNRLDPCAYIYIYIYIHTYTHTHSRRRTRTYKYMTRVRRKIAWDTSVSNAQFISRAEKRPNALMIIKNRRTSGVAIVRVRDPYAPERTYASVWVPRIARRDRGAPSVCRKGGAPRRAGRAHTMRCTCK